MAYDIAMHPRALLRTDAEREKFDENCDDCLPPSPRPCQHELADWFGIEATNRGDLRTTMWRRPKAERAKTGTEIRKELLAEVEKCVCKDRQNTYGDAEDNFADIAKIASVVLAPALKRDLTAAEVALFSAAIKMARLKTSPEHLDNWIDLAGYAVCGAGIIKRASEKR